MDKYDTGAATVGELRRRLAELGDPWLVDPDLPDDAPLPDPPRGGADPRGADSGDGDEFVRPRDLRAALAARAPAAAVGRGRAPG